LLGLNFFRGVGIWFRDFSSDLTDLDGEEHVSVIDEARDPGRME